MNQEETRKACREAVDAAIAAGIKVVPFGEGGKYYSNRLCLLGALCWHLEFRDEPGSAIIGRHRFVAEKLGLSEEQVLLIEDGFDGFDSYSKIFDEWEYRLGQEMLERAGERQGLDFSGYRREVRK